MSRSLRIAVPIDLDWPLKRHHEVFSGIQDYAKRQAPHWDLVPDMYPARRVAPRGSGPGYDGIVGRVSASDAAAARRARIPIVNVWLNSPARDQVPSVLVDYVEVGRMAGEHLASRGLRQFACAGYRRDMATRRFFEGVASVARQRHIPVTGHLASFSNSRNEKNWHRYLDGVNRWIDSWRTPIGIAATYDNPARILATECLRRGWRIPEDVAIIGANDDLMLCEGSEPELSSIDVGNYRAGYLAAELLDRLLHGGDPPAQAILTPPADLVPRQSTDVYAVADKTVGRAMRYIAEHCNQPIRVEDVVAHVGCSRGTLERQFRAAGRNSINQEIVALRIELTKRLLISTDDAIEEVAAKAGYGTAQHMRHIFRHQLGTTPTAFREKHRR
jgi:LacI family transcriptional regulator